MNVHHVWLIFHKEFIDLIRDRKTWIGAFVIPIIVIPFVVSLLGSSMDAIRKEANEYIPLIIIGNTQHELVQQIRKTRGVTLLESPDPLQSLRDGGVRAVIEIPRDLQKTLLQGNSANIRIWYDPSNQKSEIAKTIIQEAFTEYEKTIVQQRLRHVGLSYSTIKPISTQFESVASDEKISGSLLSGMFTIVLILSLASGGIACATDLIAGERERGTLETLISAPVSANSILTAKLMAVMLMSGISALASITSVSIIFSLTTLEGQSAPFTLSFLTVPSVITLLLMIILLSAMFAGVELAISTLAKSFKESQTYLTPIVFVAMVPSYMLMPLNPVDIPLLYYVLPIFNGVAVFKEIFFGELQLAHALMAIGSSMIYVLIAITLAAKFFSREDLLVK
ncbi:ABC transporter permease [Brevibacillus dissolubilis]|uniref:ABC transporter permease n=1 Tax=Brevibacillus dissolubilis TaxID=1844116 RepID=UPI001116394D|nr:ABC transporter permease [Brevibacillus dissolubilis]